MAATRRFVFAVLLVSLVLAGTVFAQVSGTWTATSTLSEARNGAASVLLQDGRVLITGGTAADGAILASTEIYGTSGVFSSAAPLRTARTGHAAALLPDGRVFVAGGNTASGPTDLAEIYDPSTNQWSAAGVLFEPRSGCTASLLANGKVLIAGGSGRTAASATMELYDPASGTISSAGSLAVGRSNHAAATLADGRVLLIGGNSVAADGSSTTLASVEIYDPIFGTTSAGAKLVQARAQHSATTLVDGRVAVIGGTNGTQDLASAELYDATANRWTTLSSSALTTPRHGHMAFLLPHNNEVLVFGGTSSSADLASSELFISWFGNAESGAFAGTGSMAFARSSGTGSPLAYDGQFLAAGGSGLASAEIYHFATITTDRPDYPPFTTVTMTGAGWQPLETVGILLHEIATGDPDVQYTVVADANGAIVNRSFATDQHDVGVKFVVTATGSKSTARTTFTDAPTGLNITKTTTTATVNAGENINFTVQVTNNTGAATTAGSVSFTDTFPAATGVGWNVSANANAGCTQTPPTGNATSVSCTPAASIANGASRGFLITSGTTARTCPAGGSNLLTNVATVFLSNVSQNSANASVTVNCPGLSLSVTGDVAAVDAGDSIGVTVTVSNSGPGTAKSVLISSVLPTGNGVNWTTTDSRCTIASGTLSCAIGDLPTGSTSVHVTSPTDGTSCGVRGLAFSASASNVPNSPAITGSGGSLVRCPSLAISKTADAATANAVNDNIGFTIVVQNSNAAGTGTAKSASLSDPLPTGTGISWSISPAYSGPGSCSISSGTLTCSFGDLAKNAMTSVHVTSATTSGSCGTYNNTATFSATNSTSSPTSGASTTVQCPVLSATKTADAATANAGDPIGFTITASNSSAAGTGKSTGTTVVDFLPTTGGLTWVAGAPSQGACTINTSQKLTCVFGQLLPGGSASVHVTSTATATSCGALNNTASLGSANSPTVQSNTATITVNCPALTLKKTADHVNVVATNQIGFVISASNSASGATATNLQVSDTLPTNTGLSWSIGTTVPAGACSITSGVLSCSFGNVAAGQSVGVHITSTTTTATCGNHTANVSIFNNATFSGTNITTASASDTTHVICVAPQITSANTTTFTTGMPGTFTVTATGAPTPTLSLTSGTPPPNVTFNPATGVLSGTPAAGTGGTYTLTFKAANGVLPDATQTFTLIVDQAPSITSANHATFKVGVPASFHVTAIGFPAPTLSENGPLPNGITFNPGTGILGGTPLQAGTFVFTFTASNGVTPDAVQTFTLTVLKGDTTSTVTGPVSRFFSSGQVVTLKATVTAAAGTPTGTVTFRTSTTQGYILGTVPLNATGTATLNTVLPDGNNYVHVTYNGDANYNSSDSLYILIWMYVN